MRSENPSEALNILNTVLAEYPNKKDALTARAEAYRLLGENEKALSDYQTILSSNPNDDGILFARAQTHRNMGNYELAINDIQTIIDQGENGDRNNIRYAYLVKGECLLALERFSEAEASLTEAKRLTPHSDAVRIQLARALIFQNKLEEAEIELKEALNLNALSNEANFLMLVTISNRDCSLGQFSTHALWFALQQPGTEHAINVLTNYFSRWEAANKGSSGAIADAFDPSGLAGLGGTAEKSAFEKAYDNIDFGIKMRAGEWLAHPLDSALGSRASEFSFLTPENQRFIVYTKCSLQGITYIENGNLRSTFHNSILNIHKKIAASRYFPAYCMYLLYNFDEQATNWINQNTVETERMLLYVESITQEEFTF